MAQAFELAAEGREHILFQTTVGDLGYLLDRRGHVLVWHLDLRLLFANFEGTIEVWRVDSLHAYYLN